MGFYKKYNTIIRTIINLKKLYKLSKKRNKDDEK